MRSYIGARACSVVASFRVIPRGVVVSVHLTDGTTAAGRVVRISRSWVELTGGKLEAGGVLHELASKRLLIPRRLVKAVEVMA